ncbi:MAG: thioredoxin family protein [Candidatus Zixiibacteriota bacterium]
MNLHCRKYVALFIVLLTGVLYTAASAAEPQRVGPVTVELIADVSAVTPGSTFDVGLFIAPDDHWHVYWKNPGDAGLPPHLKWELPAGVTVSDINWPAPVRIFSGPLAAYGYHGDALYPLTVTIPSTYAPGQTITLKTQADWLVCKEECLPGKAELSLTLPVKKSAMPANAQDIARFVSMRNRIPLPLPQSWSTGFTTGEKSLTLELVHNNDIPTDAGLEFFAADKAVIDHAAAQNPERIGDTLRLHLTQSEYSAKDPDSLAGVLAISQNGQTKYYDIIAYPNDARAPQVVAAASTSLPLALLFAFIGGLILNLMPCVLPVLSLKVLGLVHQAGQGRKAALSHGMLFTAGVLVSFWVIVGVMLTLQAGGEQLGWGFQLQSPIFVMILAGFMFLFALSLFGVFEIGFLSVAAGSVAGKAKSGASSAFVSGITATLVATPCTAPFMGAALGFSLTQSAIVAFLIYTSLALGMAAPYLVLSAFPGLLKFVPKPGAWMETLKQAMGFILAATVIWLGWVLAAQAGSTALVFLMGVLLLISIAAWIYGRWGHAAAAVITRRVGRLAAIAVIAVAFVIGGMGISAFAMTPGALENASDDGIAWQNFSRDALAEARQSGKPVFIDFTAAWCLSCQVNEKVAFSSEDVQKRFDDLDIIPFKADWTNRSDDIARALAAYGRNSVPLYVLYTPDSDEPILLPEILTPGIVLDALEKL